MEGGVVEDRLGVLLGMQIEFDQLLHFYFILFPSKTSHGQPEGILSHLQAFFRREQTLGLISTGMLGFFRWHWLGDALQLQWCILVRCDLVLKLLVLYGCFLCLAGQ
jgi:hypothetical protein